MIPTTHNHNNVAICPNLEPASGYWAALPAVSRLRDVTWGVSCTLFCPECPICGAVVRTGNALSCGARLGRGVKGALGVHVAEAVDVVVG